MISKLVVTFIPPEGKTIPSITAVSSSAPSVMPAPIPIDSNESMQRVRSAMPVSQVLSSCPAFPANIPLIPEAIAEEVRLGNFAVFFAWITANPPLPYYFSTTISTVPLVTLCNSPTTASSNGIATFRLLDLTCPVDGAFHYAGTNPPPPTPTPTTTPQTSIPGVTVPPELKPLPAPPALPVMPAIAPLVQEPLQQVIGAVQPILAQQQAQIVGQIEQQFDAIGTLVNKLPGKIGDQLVNTMGQTYGVGISLGLDVPTMEEIETGVVNFNPPTPAQPGCPVPVINLAPACPAPPQLQDITFSPVITVNVPAPGMPAPITPIAPVTVNVPAPIVIVPVKPDIIINDTTPTPSPSPAPTPTPEEPAPVVEEVPAVAPVVPPKPEEVPKPAPLILIDFKLPVTNALWEIGQACAQPIKAINFNSDELFKVFGFKRKNKDELIPPAWISPEAYPIGSKWIASLGMNIVGNLINAANNLFISSLPILNNWQDFQVLAIGGLVEKWFGFPVLPFLQSNIYNINYHNPQILPGIPDLQGLFRKGAITEEVFRCLVRANGSYDSWQMKIAESSTLVPSLFDIIRLYRGKKIGGNEFEYYANLNGLKISTPQGKTDIATFLEATRAIPGVADLVRMMVRDAADDKIAAKYGTDTDLNNKFAGQIESWSEQQGVDPEIMKYFWRSHWEIPSNTQLFDMLHKLRPNRRVGAVPANIVTTADDVKQAIQVNDLTPYWVDRVMATSYSSLTRIDAQRAFFIEAINEDQLFDAYMDIGYNAENAQVLVDFTKELKRKRDSNLPGADKPANIISQLKKYVISETNAYDRLRATGMKPEQAKKAVANSVRDRKEEARERCLKEAQRRFFRAEYDLLKYKSVVMSLGIPQENIEALVNETACLYDSRGKEINAGALCKAFKQNIIAFDQFQNRLRLIGYDKDESYIIAESCQIDKVVAIGKAKLAKETKEKAEIEKAQKAAVAAQEKAEKKAEKAKKAQEAEEKKKAKDNPAPV